MGIDILYIMIWKLSNNRSTIRRENMKQVIAEVVFWLVATLNNGIFVLSTGFNGV